jgi:non-heme chloroperoxidase
VGRVSDGDPRTPVSTEADLNKRGVMISSTCTRFGWLVGILLHFGLQAPPNLWSQGFVTGAAWADPTPHRLLRISVEARVELEVLDWGGRGEPLVFLAGGGNTAHVYDGFAPRFTSRFHVLGITRRGFGASSRPSAGYDTTTLVRDIIAVLDTLRLAKASFVAHSFGGSELNYLGAHFPQRVRRLIYLDSAYDTRAMFDSPEWKGGQLDGLPQPPTPAYDDDTGSAWSWTLWAERLSGPAFPEAEVRALLSFDAQDQFVASTSVDDWLKKLEQGAEQVDLSQIRSPALAIYAVPGSAEVLCPWWQTLDSTSRARCQKMFIAIERVLGRLRDNFRNEVANERSVWVPGARHYVFLTDPGEVTHAMLEFFLTS